MYRSTAEEYTWLQIASHTASYSILPSQVTKAFQKNPVSFQGAKHHDPTSHLLFTLLSFAVSSSVFFLLIYIRPPIASTEEDSAHDKHVWVPAPSPSQGTSRQRLPHQLQPLQSRPFCLSSLPTITPLLSILNTYFYESQRLSLLPPAVATLWPPQWQADSGVGFGLCLPCSTCSGACSILGVAATIDNCCHAEKPK